jgi:hypothetical protein
MDDASLKRYLKELVRGNIKVGMEILADEGLGGPSGLGGGVRQ